jgi:hypothetical protein
VDDSVPGPVPAGLRPLVHNLPAGLNDAVGSEFGLQYVAHERRAIYNVGMSAQTLGFAVQSEDRPVLDELVAYFGDGNRSAYLRATLKVMKSIMIANQLREAQSYGQQRTAELGIDPADVPARVQEFMKGSRPEKER